MAQYRSEIYPELCCEVCNEVIHNYFDCPICNTKDARTSFYYDVVAEGFCYSTFRCEECDYEFKPVSIEQDESYADWIIFEDIDDVM